MNKLIKKFTKTTKELHKASGVVRDRKRWYATVRCNRCNKEYTRKLANNTDEALQKHLEKQCTNCTKKDQARERLLEKALKKFPNNEFDYSLVTKEIFVNGSTPVPVICNKHNLQFPCKLYNHVAKNYGPNNPNKGGCPQCAKESQQEAETFTVSDWTRRLENKFPHISLITDLTLEDKLLGSTEVSFNCKQHGVFKTKFNYLEKCVYFCPLCAQDNNSWGGRTRRTDIEGTLYFIYIPLLKVWKLGVTKHTVEERQRDLPHEYEIVWTAKFTTLKAAYAEETRLFREYKDNRLKEVSKGLLGKAKGITELLNCSIPLTKVSLS